jgi:cytoskeletal protein RodZ
VGAFGEKLRKQREQRGLDLDAISNTTKISTRMLRALEDEHFDQLPGGIFNKGFVRAYARQVGLDEDEAVADYLAASRENQLQARSVPPDFRPPAPTPTAAAPALGDNILARDLPANINDGGTDQNQRLRTEDRRRQGRRNDNRRNHDDRRNRNDDRRDEDRRSEDRRPRHKAQKYPAADPAHLVDQSSAPIPWSKLALALVLVTLILAFWNFRRRVQPTPASPVASSNQSPEPAPPARTAATLPSAPISAATAPQKIPAAPAASATASAAGSASRPASNQPQPDDEPPVTHAAASAPAAKPPSTFTLLIRAEESTWVSLIADGKPVAQENLIAPAHTSVRATHEIVVKTGNAAGISFLLNGKEIPAQGNEGEVKTYVFDATGLRTAPQ